MATVRINSGLPEYSDRAKNISKEKWSDLMREKRLFIRIHLKADCRYLLEFLEDAEIMWKELNFKSAEDMIKNGYELDPMEVELAIQWLKIKDPNEPIPYKIAIQEGRALQKHGTNRFNNQNCRGDYITSKRGTTGKSYILARLKRDRPDILDGYVKGEYKSARAAGIAAGFLKNPTPLEKMEKLWSKLNNDEILELLREHKQQIEELIKQI